MTKGNDIRLLIDQGLTKEQAGKVYKIKVAAKKK